MSNPIKEFYGCLSAIAFQVDFFSKNNKSITVAKIINDSMYHLVDEFIKNQDKIDNEVVEIMSGYIAEHFRPSVFDSDISTMIGRSKNVAREGSRGAAELSLTICHQKIYDKISNGKEGNISVVGVPLKSNSLLIEETVSKIGIPVSPELITIGFCKPKIRPINHESLVIIGQTDAKPNESSSV